MTVLSMPKVSFMTLSQVVFPPLHAWLLVTDQFTYALTSYKQNGSQIALNLRHLDIATKSRLSFYMWTLVFVLVLFIFLTLSEL